MKVGVLDCEAFDIFCLAAMSRAFANCVIYYEISQGLLENDDGVSISICGYRCLQASRVGACYPEPCIKANKLNECHLALPCTGGLSISNLTRGPRNLSQPYCKDNFIFQSNLRLGGQLSG